MTREDSTEAGAATRGRPAAQGDARVAGDERRKKNTLQIHPYTKGKRGKNYIYL
jgi:hypothetical protein